MSIKKGMSLIAFGFLFTLVNINLNFGDKSVNIIPDCVGWILLYLSLDEIGKYAEGKAYLKWCTLALTVITGARWIYDFIFPYNPLSVLSGIISVVEAITIFTLLGIVEKIAVDYGSRKAETIHILKYFSLAGIVIIGLVEIFGTLANLRNLVLVVTALGVVMLVTAIIIAVTLFQIRKDIINQ